jgi:hypothetical protein
MWLREEEDYLRGLHDLCLELAVAYQKLYNTHKRLQTQFRIPAIVLSSLTGTASFGTTSFPRGMQRWVSIVVGLVNIGIAILASIETYLKLGELVSHSLNASSQLHRLADDIMLELSMPAENRTSVGNVFVRDMYAHYESILSTAPPFLPYEIKVKMMRLSRDISFIDVRVHSRASGRNENRDL